MTDEYGARVEDLKSRRKRNLAMGGEEKVARQHQRGKLTVRERIDLLFDPGTFVELGLLANQQPASSRLAGEVGPASSPARPEGAEQTPADGIVTGHGDI